MNRERNTAVFFAGYAALWITLMALANVRQTGALAATLGWTITLSAGILLLPDVLREFEISGGLFSPGNGPGSGSANRLPEPGPIESRGRVDPSPYG